jgi:hypothetical protein
MIVEHEPRNPFGSRVRVWAAAASAPSAAFTASPKSRAVMRALAHDGAGLIVYGSNNALDESLKKTLADTGSRLAGPSGKVTYKMLKANLFVVSGQNEQTVFYSKVLYNSHDDQFKSFELTYDRSESALYEPLIGYLAACFTDLDR